MPNVELAKSYERSACIGMTSFPGFARVLRDPSDARFARVLRRQPGVCRDAVALVDPSQPKQIRVELWSDDALGSCFLKVV